MGLTKYGDAYIYSVVEDGEVITPKSGEEFARVVAVAGEKMFKSFYRLSPGGAERFYTPMFAGPDAWREISLPLAGRDCVTLEPPFSRVDLYIDRFARIERTDVKYGLLRSLPDRRDRSLKGSMSLLACMRRRADDAVPIAPI
jgi:hypothetical protein